jgi:alpha-D-ribose 1-methylphosphonate 5-triphosphate synthase subunit PhnH
MHANAAVPPYTQDERRDRETFLALMWSCSYPGVVHTLPDDADSFTLIAHALLDLETSACTPDPALASLIKGTGARALSPERAAYHLYPAWDAAALDALALASVGTLSYPDTAATIIAPARFGTGTPFTLTGPGVDGARKLHLDGVPEAVWTLRARARFPLGWDIFLIDGRSVVGIPRSTQIERG